MYPVNTRRVDRQQIPTFIHKSAQRYRVGQLCPPLLSVRLSVTEVDSSSIEAWEKEYKLVSGSAFLEFPLFILNSAASSGRFRQLSQVAEEAAAAVSTPSSVVSVQCSRAVLRRQHRHHLLQ